MLTVYDCMRPLSFPYFACFSLPFSYLFSYPPSLPLFSDLPPSSSPLPSSPLTPCPRLLPLPPPYPPSLPLSLSPSLLLSLPLSLSPAWRGGSLVVNMAVRLTKLTESQRDQIRRQIFRKFCNVHSTNYFLLIPVWL